MSNLDIISLIERARSERGITLVALASKTGIDYARLQRVMAQKSPIKGTEMLSIARELKIAPDTLYAEV